MEACDRIAKIPQYNSRLFSRDDYRMDKEEHQELTGLCEYAVNASEQSKECFDEYESFVEEYHKQLNDRNSTKEQFNETQNIHNQLMAAIKALDPQLHQEIEQAVKEILEEEKRNESNNGSSSNTHNEQTYNTQDSSSNSNISSNYGVTSAAQTELEKANDFYQKGAIEEAKFWYRAAARHGNREAKDMCKKLNIVY